MLTSEVEFMDLDGGQRKRWVIARILDDDPNLADPVIAADGDDPQHKFLAAQAVEKFLEQFDADWTVKGHVVDEVNKTPCFLFEVQRLNGIEIMKESLK